MLKTNRFVFVGGLHKSGTSLLARCISEHPQVSRFANTGALEDEGQHLQSVYRPALEHGGAGKFGFDPEAHLTEASPLVSERNRERLLSDWDRYWDRRKEVLLEKSPPNLIRTRFLQALFPEAHFVMIVRHPAAVAFATQKWSRTGIDSLIEHWIVCHELLAADRPLIRRLHVLKYEELVKQPQVTLDTVFAFLGLDTIPCSLAINSHVNERYMLMWSEGFGPSFDSDYRQTSGEANGHMSRVAALGYDLAGSE